MHGVMDVGGNVMPWVREAENNSRWKESWENHGKALTATLWDNPVTPDGYYAIGACCTY